MSKMSNFLENALINAVLRNTSYTSPSTVYLALFLGDPTDTGIGAPEVSTSGTAYVRQEVTFSAPSNGTTANASDIIFPIATADYGTVTHIGVFDAQSSGNMLFHGALSVSKTVGSGDQLKILAGNLSISLS